MRNVILALAFLVIAVESFALTVAQSGKILDFVRGEVEWSQDYPYPVAVKLDEGSVAISFVADNTYRVVGTILELDGGDTFYGQVTCSVSVTETARGLSVDYMKSSCSCDSGIQCGENVLFDE